MNFSDQPPSKQWAALKYRGERFAEVWFKPKGEPFALTFRIPQESFQSLGMGQRLTTENLLKAVGIATEEIDSWRPEGLSHSGMNGSNPEFRHPLPSPPQDTTHLIIHVSMKRLPQVIVPTQSLEQDIPSTRWQDLVTRWNIIVGLDASIDALRQSLETVRTELEASWKQTLTPEDRMNALRADVAQWNKAKSRIHFTVPKLREFVHRATWAMGTPERKMLEEFFKNHIGTAMPIPDIGRVPEEVESLLKNRLVLSGQGTAVLQECKSLHADIQGALRTLQSNAAANARRMRDAKRSGGKFFKDVRRMTMGNN